MWPRLVNLCIGLWLTVSPAVLQMPERLAAHQYILGPVIASVALIAISESMRNLRYVNTLLGIWLLIAPWVLPGADALVIITEMMAGLLLTGLSLIKGTMNDRFGGGWRSLLADSPAHVEAAKPAP
ncbi:vitamin K epoxide reductase [Spirosoma taeanense]|uniref:Vitamin K epoxide reductase n=1 Tax=Spirosoma taeanense TaxID=2735870 RepID=A0A6M5YD66_9BACT|nr:SPW repeat protein [Spirosoma taeanense]QJW91201.1 vitamin K epoxide reductase [Spirosoma taeanense]